MVGCFSAWVTVACATPRDSKHLNNPFHPSKRPLESPVRAEGLAPQGGVSGWGQPFERRLLWFGFQGSELMCLAHSLGDYRRTVKLLSLRVIGGTSLKGL